VQAGEKKIHPQIAEDGCGKADNRVPGSPAAYPAAGETGMEEGCVAQKTGDDMVSEQVALSVVVTIMLLGCTYRFGSAVRRKT